MGMGWENVPSKCLVSSGVLQMEKKERKMKTLGRKKQLFFTLDNNLLTFIPDLEFVLEMMKHCKVSGGFTCWTPAGAL